MPTTLLKNPVSVNVASTSVGFSVAGTPAAATTGDGAQPAPTLMVEGTDGQQTTGTGQTAGTGADLSIAAGNGGGAPSGSTNGAGGSVTINPGLPGIGVGTAATFGNVMLATMGGNVGIGTSSPASSLEVNGDARVNSIGVNIAPDVAGTFGLGGVLNPKVRLNSTASLSDVYLQNSAGRLDILANDGATANMSVTNSGNIGIGTTNPSRLLQLVSTNSASTSLDVAGTAKSAAIIVQNTTDSTFVQLTARGSTAAGTTFGISRAGIAEILLNPATSSVGAIGTFSDAPLVFAANNAERMRVDTAGNVGIGTTTSGSRLHVNGGVQVGAPTGGDQGTGSINVSGDIYKNGSPLFARLKEAQALIIKLAKRVDRLEAALTRKSKGAGKAPKSGMSAKAGATRKSGKSGKERR